MKQEYEITIEHWIDLCALVWGREDTRYSTPLEKACISTEAGITID